jgi:hypothetical protein
MHNSRSLATLGMTGMGAICSGKARKQTKSPQGTAEHAAVRRRRRQDSANHVCHQNAKSFSRPLRGLESKTPHPPVNWRAIIRRPSGAESLRLGHEIAPGSVHMWLSLAPAKDNHPVTKASAPSVSKLRTAEISPCHTPTIPDTAAPNTIARRKFPFPSAFASR